jgi:glycosyltransferase involved in cell wall biosynthesis
MASALSGPAAEAEVQMLGPRSDVAELLRGADVFVFPSLPTGEGMPGVLIEAGMSALPVVATAVPGVRTIVEDGGGGFVVGVDDLDAMVEATSRLLSSPTLRRTMGDAGRQRCVTRFSLAAVADCWLSFLEPLLARAVRDRAVRDRGGRSARGSRRAPGA